MKLNLMVCGRACCYRYIRADAEFHGITVAVSIGYDRPAPEGRGLFVHLRTHRDRTFPPVIVDRGERRIALQLVAFVISVKATGVSI